MTPIKTFFHLTLLALAMAVGQQAVAAVSSDEAAKLKSELTPMGGEKAGNKDGSIPAWSGGLTAVPAGFKNGGKRPDPFAGEKPLLTITAANMDKYADKLSEGVKSLLKKYPQSYRLDVYPTHRTAAAPQWVYDNTLKNASRAKLVDSPYGLMPSGAYGGIPFPIPKSGAEVIWNHLLRWKGESWSWKATQWLVTADGKKVLYVDGGAGQQNPYYFKDGTPEKFNGDYYLIRIANDGPPIRAGEGVEAHQNINDEKTAAYVYLAGQRRVRKLPNPCCDTPSPTTAGIMTVDEIELFNGRINRFDWKLLGKKEVYIPYNSNRSLTPTKDEDMLGEHHLNPDHVRWELHRVWVVEAALIPGQRHSSAKSVYYIDEDSWYAALADRWDGKGQLEKTLYYLTFPAPDLPGTVAKTFGFYNLLSGAWYVNGLMNTKTEQYKIQSHYPDAYFTPESLSGEGVR